VTHPSDPIEMVALNIFWLGLRFCQNCLIKDETRNILTPLRHSFLNMSGTRRIFDLRFQDGLHAPCGLISVSPWTVF
jgi:hypothetical protein